jgi:hypothetical protein
MARIDRHYDGSLNTWRNAIVGLVSYGVLSLVMMLRLRKDEAAKAFLSLIHYAGRVRGLVGSPIARYA